MNIKLLTEHHLEFLGIKGGCIGSSESIHVIMPHCCGSYVAEMSEHARISLHDYLFVILRTMVTSSSDLTILSDLQNVCKVRRRKNSGIDTHSPTWESDKNTIKHYKQGPRGQPFPSRWPQGSNERMQKHGKHKT